MLNLRGDVARGRLASNVQSANSSALPEKVASNSRYVATSRARQHCPPTASHSIALSVKPHAVPYSTRTGFANSPHTTNARSHSRKISYECSLPRIKRHTGRMCVTGCASSSSEATSSRGDTEQVVDRSSDLSVQDGQSSAGLTSSEATDPQDNMDAARFRIFTEEEEQSVQSAWNKLIRWSQSSLSRSQGEGNSVLNATKKVVVFGGGSFGTAMAALAARNKQDLEVSMLVRDEAQSAAITETHVNPKYFSQFQLPDNVQATTDPAVALEGADYIIHAVPVQRSREFLHRLKPHIPPDAPILCVSKGLETGTGQMMSEVIVTALERPQPLVVLSGPSFAVELLEKRPTCLVAASDDLQLAIKAQRLMSSPSLRINTSTDVVGVEIAGALKNVLAIAAGIVEGLDLGNNSMAALVAQGCSEIRWLAEKMGANPLTLSGLAGVGDIMLTCFVNLSRNRTVGVRLGRGESLQDILATSTQVAEGVATAGAVVTLAHKYHVSLPVLTAVARILEDQVTPEEAVKQLMNLPQVPEV